MVRQWSGFLPQNGIILLKWLELEDAVAQANATIRAPRSRHAPPSPSPPQSPERPTSMQTHTPKTAPDILLVDANDDDAFFFSWTIQKHHPAWRLHRLSDGADALHYLASPHRYPAPALIVTGLRLPGLSGFELLAWAKAHPTLKHLPIIVLSDFVTPGDRQRARALGADALIEKSSDLFPVLQVLSRWLDPAQYRAAA